MSKNKIDIISFVIYVHNEESTISHFLENLVRLGDNHFGNYEIIIVDDASTDNSVTILKHKAKEYRDKKITLIQLGSRHGIDSAIRSGLDLSIGDFVYEIPSTDIDYDMEVLLEGYEAISKNKDVVFVSPKQNRNIYSTLFYRALGYFSNSRLTLHTVGFFLLSRRAINRVSKVEDNVFYRKITYQSLGLKTDNIYYKANRKVRSTDQGHRKLAFETLVIYTQFGMKISTFVSVLFLLFSLFAIVYTITLFYLGDPIEGWTTLMLVTSIGLTGLFLVLTVTIQFLSIILKLQNKKTNYLVENIEVLN